MRRAALVGVVLVTSALGITQASAQKVSRIRVDRWLVVQQTSGTVTANLQNVSRSARIGDRLQAAGDGITTAKNSTASLAVDTGIGFISVSENTQLRIQALEMAPDNGRITRLQVVQGQIRLQIRRFTNRGSGLEIQTPAGLSGVRGTEFGVGVQPNGKTGLAVLQGKVISLGRGTPVPVPGGFQNFTIPGKPPSPPVPLRNDTQLRYQFQQVIDRGVRKVRVTGQVDPVNNVTVGKQPQVTDANGRFSSGLQPVPSYYSIQITVTTPLGKKQVYDLAPR